MHTQDFSLFLYDEEELPKFDLNNENSNGQRPSDSVSNCQHLDFELKGLASTSQTHHQTTEEMFSFCFPSETQKIYNLLESDNEEEKTLTNQMKIDDHGVYPNFTRGSSFSSPENGNSEEESGSLLPVQNNQQETEEEIMINSVKKGKKLLMNQQGISLINVQINLQKKTYPNRNFPKILGLRCINLVEEGVYERGSNKLFTWLHKKYEKLLKKQNILSENRDLVEEFKKWAKSQKNCYRSLKNFREFWTKNPDLGCKELTFRSVLKKITKKFLEKDCYKWLSSKKTKIEKEHAAGYMKLIPKFLRGIRDAKYLRDLNDEID